MLVRLLILIFDESLTELVHEVCSHSHDFSLIHRLLNFAVVGGGVFGDVALQVLILVLHLHVV